MKKYIFTLRNHLQLLQLLQLLNGTQQLVVDLALARENRVLTHVGYVTPVEQGYVHDPVSKVSTAIRGSKSSLQQEGYI